MRKVQLTIYDADGARADESTTHDMHGPVEALEWIVEFGGYPFQAGLVVHFGNTYAYQCEDGTAVVAEDVTDASAESVAALVPRHWGDRDRLEVAYEVVEKTRCARREGLKVAALDALQTLCTFLTADEPEGE